MLLLLLLFGSVLVLVVVVVVGPILLTGIVVLFEPMYSFDCISVVFLKGLCL